MADETATTVEVKATVQKYRQRAKHSFSTFEDAVLWRDGRDENDTHNRTRILRRADGTFDVVIYDEIKVVTK